MSTDPIDLDDIYPLNEKAVLQRALTYVENAHRFPKSLKDRTFGPDDAELAAHILISAVRRRMTDEQHGEHLKAFVERARKRHSQHPA